MNKRIVRLEKLEEAAPVLETGYDWPGFWQAISGAVEVDQLDPKTRSLFDSAFVRQDVGRDCPIEAAIRSVASSARPAIETALLMRPNPTIEDTATAHH